MITINGAPIYQREVVGVSFEKQKSHPGIFEGDILINGGKSWGHHLTAGHQYTAMGCFWLNGQWYVALKECSAGKACQIYREVGACGGWFVTNFTKVHHGK